MQDDVTGLLQETVNAADKGNRAKFIQLMGGFTAKRQDHPIKLFKEGRGRYGNPIKQVICGIQTEGLQLRTRIHCWCTEKVETFKHYLKWHDANYPNERERS